jgi:hypothetical protein
MTWPRPPPTLHCPPPGGPRPPPPRPSCRRSRRFRSLPVVSHSLPPAPQPLCRQPPAHARLRKRGGGCEGLSRTHTLRVVEFSDRLYPKSVCVCVWWGASVTLLSGRRPPPESRLAAAHPVVCQRTHVLSYPRPAANPTPVPRGCCVPSSVTLPYSRLCCSPAPVVCSCVPTTGMW